MCISRCIPVYMVFNAHLLLWRRNEELHICVLFSMNYNLTCCRCDAMTPVMYNILEKYNEVTNYIITNKNTMFNRAPPEWLSPPLPDCEVCGGPGCMRPVMAVKKRHINWLFLLLGQTLGCCNLDQLKYFCKHSKNHRTGSKSHVLYLTYLTLCNQLDPSFPSF
jgi:hypothetical protein